MMTGNQQDPKYVINVNNLNLVYLTLDGVTCGALVQAN